MTGNLTDIIKGSIEGNRAAQEKLYGLHARKMYAVCLRYSNNADEAKDILQDGFIKVFENLSNYRFLGSFEGWIRRIIVNTALARYRQQKIQIQPLDDSTTFVDDTEEADFPCDISSEKLMSMVQELSPHYRMVFNLYAIEGYSHRDIAQKLGISEGTSKSNLSRARLILQKKVQNYVNKEYMVNS